jgi:4-hydroxybenzoate polyprenyltransferase
MEQQIRVRDCAAPPPKVAMAERRALVVDLEGVLLRSDLAQEALFSNAAGSLACLRDAVLGGKGAFLDQVLAAAEIDYARLPYDTDVLNLGLAARAQGRKIYIAATRYPDHATAIASHLGFDGVVTLADLTAGAETTNRANPAPPFDARSFDYIGNGRAPESVWRAACTTYVVGGSDHLSKRLALLNPSLKRIGGGDTSWRTWLNALRVHQYAKNTLVFVPALTSHQVNLASLGSAFLAFMAFSACASSAYLLNDLFDLAADRQHPSKRYRAIASGALPISTALIAIPILWIASAVAGLSISSVFVVILGAYLATTMAYSLFLKKKMLVDIVTLAGLYTVRILGGAVAIGVYLSEWLMVFSLFVFTSLALIKRYSELAMRQESGLSNPVNRDYRISDLQIVAAMAAASGMNAITVLSLYVSSPVVAQAYSRPWMLWLLNPLLLYWIGRALMLAHRREMADDPIVYTFKDNASRIVVLAMMCIVLAAI